MRARLLVAVMMGLLASAAAAQEPRFFIQSIAVDGLRYASETVVVTESHLRVGNEYSESDLRDAIARITRLPFVFDASFALEKGSVRDTYVLRILLRENKPLFGSIDWSHSRISGLEDEEGTRLTERHVVVGGRWFVGGNGLIHGTVEPSREQFSLGYVRYRLLGTGASVAATVGYEQRDAPQANAQAERFTRTDDLTFNVTLAAPLGGNHSVRMSWDRKTVPFRFATGFFDNPDIHIVKFHADAARLAWLYDTTDDPLFPMSGTRATAGAAFVELPYRDPLAIHEANDQRFTRELRRDVSASVARHWEPLPQHSVMAGASYLTQEHRGIRTSEYLAHAGYAAMLRESPMNSRLGDLRLEGEAAYLHLSYGPANSTGYSTLRASLAYRSEWGVARFSIQYIGWERERD
jgi:hypothetical protein